ncbi:MAG: ECF transporter S component [Lachnospiraceae bacterium]|nr:ECF transporter S component [Lachnospiraceae bacterium]
MKKTAIRTRKLCFAALLLALGWILPLLTGQNRDLGNMLSLIHIPAYLGGFLLGPWYGMLLGLLIPLSRSVLFGMPVLYPRALCMAFEMAAYGGICGGLYQIFSKNRKIKNIVSIYISIIPAMLLGRVVWGAGRAVCGLFASDAFTWSAFIAGGFATAWPGMVAQLIILPVLIIAIEKSGLFGGDDK